jgi:hypothetical protein
VAAIINTEFMRRLHDPWRAKAVPGADKGSGRPEIKLVDLKIEPVRRLARHISVV